MWRPGHPIPQEFLDLLEDNEEEDESEGELEVELEEEEDEEETGVANLMAVDIIVEEEDGELVPLEALSVPPSTSRYERDLASRDERLSSNSSGDGEVSREMLRYVSPLSVHDDELPRFRVEELPDAPGPAAAAARGRGATRGGRTGRGRGGRGMRRGRGGSGWVRGQPLVERFVADDELPAQMRQDIGRLLANRNRRERVARERRINENMNEQEEAFYDCEDFQWQPMDGWQGRKETFLPENPGPTSVFDNAYDAFRAYWDDTILSHIVTESNRYSQGIRSMRFRHDWVPTNLDEILVLFAFWMMLSIIRMPTIKSCFSKLPIMRTDIFRFLFTEKRYWNINRAFHLADGSRDPNDPENVLFPMGPILDHLNTKFQEHYIMDQAVCIDESLTLWKGPLSFMQYIKMKAARFGIKTFQLCESATGYLWSFFVYVGRRTTPDSALPSSVSTVMKLVQPILNLGHVLYMDNWFNSPQLARFLKRHRTDCVGTLRSNSKNVPVVIQKAVLAEGEFVARQSGDVAVVALQDKKRLHLITTCHDTTQIQKEGRPGRPAQFKLELVDDYNRGMGGVDRLDQMLEPYLVERKQCRKWTKKFFKRLLNISIQNARILLEKSSGTKVDSLAFRLTLVQSIMDRHLPHVPRGTERQAVPSQFPLPVRRLTERHFIRRKPVTEEMLANTVHRSNLGRGYCAWCKKCERRTKTVFECPECNVPLCLEKCFRLFHSYAEPLPEHMGRE